MKTRKLIFLSLISSFALILGLLESYFPMPIPVPGAKLGLSNIAVLIVIYFFGYKEALIVAAFKSLLLMIVTGNVSAFLFSFVAAIVSCFAMIICHKYFSKHLSVVSVSVVGACFHNFAQVCVAAFILKSFYIFSYLPILLIVSLFTGYIVGFPVQILVKRFIKK
jgi:heptaprenyl diphosphate synthase